MRRSFRFGIAITLVIEPAVFAGAIIAILPRAVLTRTILTRAILPWTDLAVLPWPIFTRPIFTRPIIAGPSVTLAVLTRTLFAVFTGTIIARAFFARFPLLAGWGTFERGEIAFDAEFVTIVFAVLFLPAFTVRASLAGTLIFQADPAVGDHAEIVVCKLEIVFGLHAITIEMSVLCELAILLEHLGGIAPCAAVDSVKLLSTTLRATGIAAPATAVVTTIVIQLRHFLVWGQLMWNAGRSGTQVRTVLPC